MSKERKELEEIPPIPRETLYEMIREAGETSPYGRTEEEAKRDQGLMASFYLIANRCSEGLALTSRDISLEVSVEILDEELSRMVAYLGRLRTEIDIGISLGRDVGNQQIELGELFDEYQEMNRLRTAWDRPGDRMEAADEILTRYPQTRVYVVRLITLKRKKRIPRNIPVPTIDPLGPFFIDRVKKMGESLFDITRQRVWQIFDRVGIYDFFKDHGYPVPKNPLRHSRLSEVNNFFTRTQLDRYAGWKIKGTADRYIHAKWADFVVPLVKAARTAPPFEV